MTLKEFLKKQENLDESKFYSVEFVLSYDEIKDITTLNISGNTDYEEMQDIIYDLKEDFTRYEIFNRYIRINQIVFHTEEEFYDERYSFVRDNWQIVKVRIIINNRFICLSDWEELND